jgi:predicted short-subunit dehydrogenase-like oxidoreductase (DUF2520 family)
MNGDELTVSFIGAGRVASTLSRAFALRGIAVGAIASRNPASAARLAAVAGGRATTLQDAARADLVFMTVPDDDIESICDGLSWRPDQGVVHCSGATEVSALAAARRAGARIGGFHPLQIFSDPDRAVDLMAGTTVAIEGPPELVTALTGIATRLGMIPLSLPPGARAAYHGGASFAASFLVSMIEEAVAMWATFGVAERDALAALLPLTRGVVAALESRGVVGAVSGPISRGDAGVVARHLVAFDQAGENHGRLYREFAYRQLRLALADGRIDTTQAERLRMVFGAGVDPSPSEPAP